MGYGLDTEKYPDRKWGNIITWRTKVKSGSAIDNARKAFNIWQSSLGGCVKFSETSEGSEADCEVFIGMTSGWSNYSKGPGRPESNKTGKLDLRETAIISDALHEIGHLLGLGHEQDHPHARDEYYKEKPGFGLETAKMNSKHINSYSDYNEGSIMLYGGDWKKMSEPHADDVATVKKVNGWT